MGSKSSTQTYSSNNSEVLMSPSSPLPIESSPLTYPTESSVLPEPTEWIYVLACSDGKYYVGRTNNVERRFEEHQSGNCGSAWTRLHKPLPWPRGLLYKKPLTGNLDEDHEVEKLMSTYGLDNVRGGSYVTIVLKSTDRTSLEKKLSHSRNECFNCGGTDHYITNCPSLTKQSLGEIEECKPSSKKTSLKVPQVCSRCGRNHNSDKCYAKTKLDGSALDPLTTKDPCLRCDRNYHGTCTFKTNKAGKYL